MFMAFLNNSANNAKDKG